MTRIREEEEDWFLVICLKMTCKTGRMSARAYVHALLTFLPRDAMHKRGLCRHAVSVCVCVCHVRGSCENE